MKEQTHILTVNYCLIEIFFFLVYKFIQFVTKKRTIRTINGKYWLKKKRKKKAD